MIAHAASLLLLSFAVSLDGFGVGITYGLRRIRIPAASIAIIALCSGLVILLSMLLGSALQSRMSAHGASIVGAVILIGVGGLAVFQFLRSWGKEDGGEDGSPAMPKPMAVIESDAEPNGAGKRTVLRLELRRFGLIIHILRTPSAADVDRSGTITPGEAMLLGTALSLDALGAGIGAGLVGFAPAATALAIAAASGTFLWLGTRVGFWVTGLAWVKRLSVLPGLILILMGIIKLL